MVQQISNQLTTGTSTPALVAQALSGNTILKQLFFYLLPLLDDLASIFKEHSDATLTSKRLLLFYH